MKETGSAIRLPTQRRCPLDLPDEFQSLRQDHPVTRLAFPDGRVGWLVTRYDDVRAGLADPRFSSVNARLTSAVRKPVLTEEERADNLLAKSFINMDPPAHTRQRRLLTAQFTVRRMRLLTPFVEQVVDELLDALAVAPQPVDIVSALALPVSSMVMCELLGVPYADRELFEELTAAMIRLSATREELLAAGQEMRDYMTDLVNAKRAAPGQDIISGLVAAEPVGEPLDETELVAIANLLLIAGHETTANMVSLAVLTLLAHPEQWNALRDDPSLADPAAEELFRHQTVVQFGLTRCATTSLQLGGQDIGAGDYVVFHLGSANRDATRFPLPDTLDIHRGVPYHVGFGHGVHQCLGQQLARIILRVVLTRLVARFPTLTLAAPLDQLHFRHDMADFGLYQLPVTWK